MPVAKLTRRVADGIWPSGKRDFGYDADLTGLGLKVEPSGVKTWIVEYRAGSGGGAGKRRMTLGKVGSADNRRRSGLVLLASEAVVRSAPPLRIPPGSEGALTMANMPA